MIIELIILFTLKNNSLNIYEIKKFIEHNFSLFYKISIGTLHPALKRLSAKGYLDLDKKISSGGQRQSLYKITEKGNEYFCELLNSDIPDNPTLALQFADVFAFIISDNNINEQVIKKTKENLVKFFELKKIEAGKFSKNNNVSDSLIKYIQTYINTIDEKIKYFKLS